MYKSYLLFIRPFAWKGIVRLVAPLLLSTLVLIGVVRPNSAYGNANDLVGLTVHNDKSGQTNYIVVTGRNTDSNTPMFCQPIPPLDWVGVQSSPNVPLKATPGQIIWLGYFSSPQCDPSSNFMSVILTIPAVPIYDHCWFNPDNTITPNWSGCINPSQILPINWNPTVDTSALKRQIWGQSEPTRSGDSNLQRQQQLRFDISQVAKKVLQEASLLKAAVLTLTQLFTQILPLVYTIDNKHIDSYPLLS